MFTLQFAPPLRGCDAFFAPIPGLTLRSQKRTKRQPWAIFLRPLRGRPSS